MRPCGWKMAAGEDVAARVGPHWSHEQTEPAGVCPADQRNGML
ncbi:MAG: hypothetical protein O6941_10115 [Planctomycetota bacterium]|nr:hypothetical protein [Planctomycetota bacterium]MCZ6612978.1 hypothetical protein [Planctomycetota bacterium]